MGKKEKNPKAVGAGRMLAWQSRAISQGCALMAIGFLSVYCTDTLKMNPALVGTLLVVSKLLDGFTDIIAGYLVDKTNTKVGEGTAVRIVHSGCLVLHMADVFLFSPVEHGC